MRYPLTTSPHSARLMSQVRAGSDGSSAGSYRPPTSSLGRSPSAVSSGSKFAPRRSSFASNEPAPPPYTGGSASPSLATKRPPPPPPAPKPRAAVTYVTALYDYAATVRLSLLAW